MIRKTLKILAALLENCASAINERLDPPLPMVSFGCAEEMHWIAQQQRQASEEMIIEWRRYQHALAEACSLFPANDETITRH